MKYLFLAIMLCLGTGLFAWLNFDEAPALIDQPETEEASTIEEPDPMSIAAVPISESDHASTDGSATPSSEVAHFSARFQFLTDPSIRWQLRANHLRELDANTLSQADVDALYELLHHRPLPEHAEDW